MLHLCVACRARVVELRTERFWTRECTRLVPERTGVQRLSIRTRYGDMAPDCCTEYSLGKLYLTLSLPPSSPERRGQSWCDELIVIVTYIVEAVFVAKLFILL